MLLAASLKPCSWRTRKLQLESTANRTVAFPSNGFTEGGSACAIPSSETRKARFSTSAPELGARQPVAGNDGMPAVAKVGHRFLAPCYLPHVREQRGSLRLGAIAPNRRAGISIVEQRCWRLSCGESLISFGPAMLSPGSSSAPIWRVSSSGKAPPESAAETVSSPSQGSYRLPCAGCPARAYAPREACGATIQCAERFR